MLCATFVPCFKSKLVNLVEYNIMPVLYILMHYALPSDLRSCEAQLKAIKAGSVFTNRTDAASAEQYFQVSN